MRGFEHVRRLAWAAMSLFAGALLALIILFGVLYVGGKVGYSLLDYKPPPDPLDPAWGVPAPARVLALEAFLGALAALFGGYAAAWLSGFRLLSVVATTLCIVYLLLPDAGESWTLNTSLLDWTQTIGALVIVAGCMIAGSTLAIRHLADTENHSPTLPTSD